MAPGDGFPSILVPVAAPAYQVTVRDVEFLEPSHPSYALRPARPLQLAWTIYSPRVSYAFSAPTPIP